MIRQYNESEIPQLVEIWYQASTLAHPFLTEDFVAKVKHDMTNVYLPDSNTWVYEDNNEILGFIAMIDNEIGGLFVNPKHHSKGIGTQLVNHMKNYFKTLEVEVFKNNAIGFPFYQKYGFQIIKEYTFEAANQQVLRMRYTKV